MADIINEALLEMHFLRALVEYYSDKYGKKYLKLLKPSPQNEVWVGFDQGWVNTSVDTTTLYNELKSTIQSDEKKSKSLYLGIFLQFKLVEKILRKSKHMPSSYKTPYYRIELSLKPNERSNLSQHETLLRLSKVKNATVSYACGMLFNINDVYEEPDISRLRLVPIATAPNGWTTNERHFITFENEVDKNPLWCSEPVEGKSYSVQEWLSPESNYAPKLLNGEQVMELIDNSTAAFEKILEGQGALFSDESILPENMIIIEFKNYSDYQEESLNCKGHLKES